MKKNIEKKLIEKFKDRNIFSREELFNFYTQYEPELKQGTFGWRIYNLKNKGILKSVRRGYYTIKYKPVFEPQISKDLLKLTKYISAQFENIKYCLWNTDWINEFSQHQSNKKMIIIEIEKDFVESLYYQLKDTFSLDFYLNPDNKTIDFYISESQNPVIIKKLITRSPVSKRSIKKTIFYIPTLEKILVDIYSEEKLFYFYRGAELVHIFENALKNYTINYTKLLSYAKRREKEEDINNFISNHIDPFVKNINE